MTSFVAHSFIHSFMCFCVLPADDFADEEEVQSFGYKRFGEYRMTSWLPAVNLKDHLHWFISLMTRYCIKNIFSKYSILLGRNPPTITHKVKRRPHLVSQKRTYFWLLLSFVFLCYNSSGVQWEGKPQRHGCSWPVDWLCNLISVPELRSQNYT